MKKVKKQFLFFLIFVLLIALLFSQYPPHQSLMATNIPASRTLHELLLSKGITAPGNRITIFVDKSEQTLTIKLDGQPIKTYHAEFGDNGIGDKKIAGDHKTPEGTFYVSEKSVLSPADKYLGSRWMRLSYPNIEDGHWGLKTGLIDKATYAEIISAFNQKRTPPQRTPLGGGVGIHGGSVPEFGHNWTWGCVGLSNKDVEEIYDFVTIGTPVIIQR
jgi:lipoprotein-anchoring transpeptidase ErfK/SrfK